MKTAVGLLLLFALLSPASGKADPFDLNVAAEWGQLPRVKELVEKGYDVNYAHPRLTVVPACFGKSGCISVTPFVAAAALCREDVLEFLIARGAKVTPIEATYALCSIVGTGKDLPSRAPCQSVIRTLARMGAELEGQHGALWACGDTPFYRTPLMTAAYAGYTDDAESLLNAGAAVRTKTPEGWTALNSAGCRADMVELLLAAGADPCTLFEGKTPGRRAVELRDRFSGTGCEPVVPLLTKEKCAQDAPTSSASAEDEQAILAALPAGDSRRVFYGVKHGDRRGVVAALNAGAPIDARDAWGFTPLIIAAAFGNADLVKLLLQRGARIDSQGHNGMTALMAACQADAGVADTVLVLAAAKPDMRLKDKKGRSAEDWAQGLKQYQALEIIRRFKNGKSRPSPGEIALLRAITDGDVSAAMAAIGSGVPVDTPDSLGNTTLMMAAQLLETEAVVKLLSLGANPNAATKRGWTPLMAACSAGSVDSAVVLIAKKADIGRKDADGLTAKDWARKSGQTKVLDMFARLESGK